MNPMKSKTFSIAAALLFAACGDAQDDEMMQPSPPSYAQMNREQRLVFMSTVVMPEMAPLFSAFDAKYQTQSFSCTTCHGSGFTDGTFAMPSPQVPPLPATEEAFAEYVKDPEHARWSQFMLEKVWPKMADLLQVPKFDPTSNPTGFSCHNCHTLMGP